MWNTLIFAFFACFFLSVLVLKFFPLLGLMDRPKRYGLKRKPIPYPGGVAIFLTVLLAILIFLPLDPPVLAVLLGASLLSITSFVDDRRGLSPFLRLGVQALAALILLWGGLEVTSVTNPLGGSIELSNITFLTELVTVLWVMSMVNAFNWLDGVPGMTSSISAVSALTLLLLSIRPEFHYLDQSLAISLSAIILGTSLAFLIFDFPKPKMIMGDTGSMLLGFLLASAAIISGAKIATTILVLGFPILDFVWVIVRRIRRGQSPFKGDLQHFHHQFLNAGYSERRVVLFFIFSALIFGASALFLSTGGKLIAISFVLILMTSLYGLVQAKD